MFKCQRPWSGQQYHCQVVSLQQASGRSSRNAAAPTTSSQGGVLKRNLARAGPPRHINDGGHPNAYFVFFLFSFATLEGGVILLKIFLESPICYKNEFCLQYIKQSTFRKLAMLRPRVRTHMQLCMQASSSATWKFSFEIWKFLNFSLI